tara:strand:+ start:1077 stop:1271 length:195 start_codon:yes stop_codon:yes gene_type:complete
VFANLFAEALAKQGGASLAVGSDRTVGDSPTLGRCCCKLGRATLIAKNFAESRRILRLALLSDL